MSDFRNQIKEDILEYQSRFPHISNIRKDEWAFNFWVLDKLFSEEEDLIEEKIVDYNDKGIDCFIWHEDSLDLYLIQNKYYADGTNLTVDYVFNDFLTRSLGALEKGTYTRSAELQDIFNKYHEEEGFCIHFQLYVTNNTCINTTLVNKLKEYNQKNASKHLDVKMFSLSAIEELYYRKPTIDKKKFSFVIQTINKGTLLKIDNAAYKMTLAADARYVLTPVVCVYNMLKASKEAGYPLFNENIREYLGANGSINKGIVDTLKDPSERNNFFFYNNGITMIVDEMDTDTLYGSNRVFKVSNPQIVNGCQTVNSIFETLDSLPSGKLEKDFENTFVMIRILKIPSDSDSLKELYQRIVKYNNSQNAIDEKSFVASQDVFRRLQIEFEGKGFLVCIKQSDKHQYSIKYPKISPLVSLNKSYIQKFKLDCTKLSDYVISLEKLLQIFVAFYSKPLDAIQNKSKLLKGDSQQNKMVVEFIKNPQITSKDMVNLLLLYWRAEKEKNCSTNGKEPNSFYLIHWFAKYDCKDKAESISEKLSSEADVQSIIKKYKIMFKRYYSEWTKANDGKDYNTMIKSPINLDLENEAKNYAEDVIAELES